MADLIAGSFPTGMSFTDKLSGFDVWLTDCEICGLDMPASEKRTRERPNFSPMCFTLPAQQEGQREYASQTVMSAIMSRHLLMNLSRTQ